jgi:hypothetical protein
VATFLAIYEIFLKRIFPQFSRIRVFRVLFPLAAVIVAFLAFVSAVHFVNTRTAFYITSRVFDFLRSAVIGFFVLLILFLGREFAGPEFGVAAGFGVQAAVALANWAIKSFLPGVHDIDRYEPIAFDLSCVIWLWAFLKARKPPVPTQSLDVRTLHEARKWESSLKDWLTPGKK